MDPDFEQLSNDVDLIARMKDFSQATDKITDILKYLDDPKLYDSLSNAQKIKYNLLMSYSMNTLFWMYLRAEGKIYITPKYNEISNIAFYDTLGVNPTTHQVRAENERLKKSMERAQQIKDRKTIMPRLNKNVAQRFIRSGLWTPNEANESSSQNDEPEEDWDKPTDNATNETANKVDDKNTS